MPPIRVASIKATKTERTHEENQERSDLPNLSSVVHRDEGFFLANALFIELILLLQGAATVALRPE